MTAQEIYNEWKQAKTKAENYKKYHIDTIEKYNGLILAESTNFFYKLRIYSDNSAALLFIAKPGSGCKNGHYCGTNSLKYHFSSLNHDKKTIIPNDWKIIEQDFFTALNIA